MIFGKKRKLVTYSEKWEEIKGYHLVIGIKGGKNFTYIFDDYETCVSIKNKITGSIAAGNKVITYSHTGPKAFTSFVQRVWVKTMMFVSCDRLVETLVPTTKFEETTILSSEVLFVSINEVKYDKLVNYMSFNVTEEEMDQKVLQWHETNFPAGKEPKLYEYLGMTEREYSDYVEHFYVKVWKKSSK